VAGAVGTLWAGFGIEALAEVVTATAAGDKAKVAHMASSRSPFSSSKSTSSALAPWEHLAHERMLGFHVKTIAELREHAPAQIKRPGLQPSARPGNRHLQPGSHNILVLRAPQASSASTETRA
jgi:hypothetical protein